MLLDNDRSTRWMGRVAGVEPKDKAAGGGEVKELRVAWDLVVSWRLLSPRAVPRPLPRAGHWALWPPLRDCRLSQRPWLAPAQVPTVQAGQSSAPFQQWNLPDVQHHALWPPSVEGFLA